MKDAIKTMYAKIKKKLDKNLGQTLHKGGFLNGKMEMWLT